MGMVGPNDSEPVKVKDIPPSEECAPCKVTGVFVLSAFALYWNHLRLATPKAAKRQRIFLGTTSLGNLAPVVKTNVIFYPTICNLIFYGQVLLVWLSCELSFDFPNNASRMISFIDSISYYSGDFTVTDKKTLQGSCANE